MSHPPLSPIAPTAASTLLVTGLIAQPAVGLGTATSFAVLAGGR